MALDGLKHGFSTKFQPLRPRLCLNVFLGMLTDLRVVGDQHNPVVRVSAEV